MLRLASFLSGLLFALGLGLGGMTRPDRVIGFLDVAGQWNPSLIFVMTGALAVTVPGFALILRRQTPLAAPRFVLPEGRAVDKRLLMGAALFGVGWGISGYCPGPALVSLVTVRVEIIVFVVAMLVGQYMARRLFR